MYLTIQSGGVVNVIKQTEKICNKNEVYISSKPVRG